MPSPFPALRERAMLRILFALGYVVARQTGSHKRLKFPREPGHLETGA
jgi:predicted RNA binding protein YcfA (HicA-like mRNA interferase family)